MEVGYIKVSREWFAVGLHRSHELFAAACWLTAQAAFADRIYVFKSEPVRLLRGQLVISREQFAEALGVSVQSGRSILQKLKMLKIINCQSTNRYTVVTVRSMFADGGEPTSGIPAEVPAMPGSCGDIPPTEKPANNQPTTSQQPANNQLSTTKKELKNNLSPRVCEALKLILNQSGNAYNCPEFVEGFDKLVRYLDGRRKRMQTAATLENLVRVLLLMKSVKKAVAAINHTVDKDLYSLEEAPQEREASGIIDETELEEIQ